MNGNNQINAKGLLSLFQRKLVQINPNAIYHFFP